MMKLAKTLLTLVVVSFVTPTSSFAQQAEAPVKPFKQCSSILIDPVDFYFVVVADGYEVSFETWEEADRFRKRNCQNVPSS
jgi:hypothetical protein